MKHVISLMAIMIIGFNVIMGLFKAITTGNIPTIFILVVVLITLLFFSIGLVKYIREEDTND